MFELPHVLPYSYHRGREFNRGMHVLMGIRMCLQGLCSKGCLANASPHADCI